MYLLIWRPVIRKLECFRLAIPDHFIEHGTVDSQRMKTGLNVQAVLDAVEQSWEDIGNNRK